MSAIRKIQSTVHNYQPLRVIKSGLHPTSKREKRIEQFWMICHATLWNTREFSFSEQAEFKQLIAEHFRGSKNPDVTFKQLIERVCLAKRYVTRKKGRYISKPIDWLNIHYKNGLAGTASWYKEVCEQRKTVPHYNEGIKLLAKAMLYYCEKRNPFDVRRYRKELLELKQHDLVQCYMNSILHMHYLNV